MLTDRHFMAAKFSARQRRVDNVFLFLIAGDLLPAELRSRRF